MRIAVEAPRGAVADHPDAALDALLAIAKAEGVEPSEWLAKALSAKGVVTLAVPVVKEPRYAVIDDRLEEIMDLYERAIQGALDEIRELLDGVEGDKSAYATP